MDGEENRYSYFEKYYRSPERYFFQALEIDNPVFMKVSKENSVLKVRAVCNLYSGVLLRDFECRRELDNIIMLWRNKPKKPKRLRFKRDS
jgi:hypothetical protein